MPHRSPAYMFWRCQHCSQRDELCASIATHVPRDNPAASRRCHTHVAPSLRIIIHTATSPRSGTRRIRFCLSISSGDVTRPPARGIPAGCRSPSALANNIPGSVRTMIKTIICHPLRAQCANFDLSFSPLNSMTAFHLALIRSAFRAFERPRYTLIAMHF